jgi:Na+/proline symporter
VFAAAMSSLDSALNSLSAALTTDFLKRFRPRRLRTPAPAFAKVVVVTAGILGIIIGIYAARTEAPLIDLILTFMGYFAGGLLGLFLLGMLTKRAQRHRRVFIGRHRRHARRAHGDARTTSRCPALRTLARLRAHPVHLVHRPWAAGGDAGGGVPGGT